MAADDYTLDDVARMSAGKDSYSLQDVAAMTKGKATPAAEPAKMQSPVEFAYKMLSSLGKESGRREVGNLAAGGVRGTADIGDTLLNAGSWLVDKITPGGTPDLKQANANRGASLDQFDEGFKGSLPYGVGRLGTNIAGTLGVGPAMSLPMRALGGASPVATAVASALGSGGMSTGGQALGRGADLAIRTVGGGLTGAASAGLVDPSSMLTGGGIGSVLPGALQGANLVASGAGKLARNLRTPGDVKLARDIAAMTGINPANLDEIARVRDALRQAGPQMIPGAESTVPQILQSPGVSQLQRSVRATAPAAFVEREAQQQAALMGALDRVAPVTGALPETADEVGNAISGYANSQREIAKRAVSAKFQAVDPFNESAINLPIDEMQAAKDKFLGPGTFGSGGSAQHAVDEARRIGSEAMPAIRATNVGRPPQDIVQAVRAAGGINPMSRGGIGGEISELGRKQSGTTGLVSGRGQDVERLAVQMHERGFIPDSDPVTLLNAIRGNLSGEAHYAADLGDNAFAGLRERAMGEAPDAARALKPVSFEELQNLRSSIGEQWRAAQRQGNAKEAAALISQQRAIDKSLDNLAAGNGGAGEFFDSQMANTYKEARSAHAARKGRFDTGPQSAMFRVGRDGERMAQGAEIPRKFFNGSVSQIEDAQAFVRLVGRDQKMMAELKRYAMTDAAGQVDRFGNLTNHKFNKWLDSRSGALGHITSEEERALLKSIAESLRKSDVAESLGRSTGSDTAQKIASMTGLGLMDGAGANVIAGRVPGGRFVLDLARGPLRAGKAERLGGLLTNPEQTASLLDQFIATQQPRQPLSLLGNVDPLMYRAAPTLLSGGGR